MGVVVSKLGGTFFFLPGGGRVPLRRMIKLRVDCWWVPTVYGNSFSQNTLACRNEWALWLRSKDLGFRI